MFQDNQLTQVEPSIQEQNISIKNSKTQSFDDLRKNNVENQCSSEIEIKVCNYMALWPNTYVQNTNRTNN